MRISFFELKGWQKDFLREKLTNFTCDFYEKALTSESLNSFPKQLLDSEILVPFVVSKLDVSTLSEFSNLKFIATASTGYDHIDLDYCKQRGIRVSNVPRYGENTVAEYTFMLILALLRKLPQSVEKIKRGEFSPEGLTGNDLKGKILGVVGTGAIGRNVIRIAKGFEMSVLAFDVQKNEKLQTELGFSYVSLSELLEKSDIVSLHLPYCKSTHHLINKTTIKLMKKDAFLINTARGGVVETDALFDALKSQKIAGAGLDVLEEESYLKEEAELLYRDTETDANLKTVIQNHVLMNLPNVIITPHNAFNSVEALERILSTTVGNIVSFTEGKQENAVV